jgi:hypothetical protein
MQEYILTKVTRYTTDKAGQPLKTKDGRPYTRVNIQTQEHGQKWLSGFGSNTNVNWKEGDKVELIVKENGEYLNFSEPKKTDLVDEKLEQILNKLTTISLTLNSLKGLILTPDKLKELEREEKGYNYPESEGEVKF